MSATTQPRAADEASLARNVIRDLHPEGRADLNARQIRKMARDEFLPDHLRALLFDYAATVGAKGGAR